MKLYTADRSKYQSFWTVRRNGRIYARTKTRSEARDIARQGNDRLNGSVQVIKTALEAHVDTIRRALTV